jgi:hypothetical protein
MTSEFLTYLRLGFTHIADVRGYDHILFVAALTGGYALGAWRRLAWLVTAFTVGHSITLALATLGLVRPDAAVVEVLIPATILVTSVLAVVTLRPARDSRAELYRAARLGTTRPGAGDESAGVPAGALYALALAFGLVHGLGFSALLRALLGAESSIALPLLAFNVGLELGQLLIVAVTLLVGTAVVRVGYARRDWVLLLAGATGGVALVLLAERVAALGAAPPR